MSFTKARDSDEPSFEDQAFQSTLLSQLTFEAKEIPLGSPDDLEPRYLQKVSDEKSSALVAPTCLQGYLAHEEPRPLPGLRRTIDGPTVVLGGGKVAQYRGTSLIRKHRPVRPCSRLMARTLWWS